MTVMLSFNICSISVYADAKSCIENTSSPDLCEFVKIENVIYEYDYFVKEGHRTILITNTETNQRDILDYDIENGTIYLNNEIFSESIEEPIIQYSRGSGTTADGWTIISKESRYVSWVRGTTIAIVAGVIAAYLGAATSHVYTAMGYTALGVLAACCSGGTLDIEMHMYSTTAVAPQYRYQWKFTANTGDVYGYYYMPAY